MIEVVCVCGQLGRLDYRGCPEPRTLESRAHPASPREQVHNSVWRELSVLASRSSTGPRIVAKPLEGAQAALRARGQTELATMSNQGHVKAVSKGRREARASRRCASLWSIPPVRTPADSAL